VGGKKRNKANSSEGKEWGKKSVAIGVELSGLKSNSKLKGGEEGGGCREKGLLFGSLPCLGRGQGTRPKSHVHLPFVKEGIKRKKSRERASMEDRKRLTSEKDQGRGRKGVFTNVYRDR